MFIHKTEQILEAPLNEVFPFFATPENLEKITPSNLGFIIKTPRPLVMKKGATFEYTIKLGIIRFPWITVIKEYHPPYMFQDIQRFGPYKKWEHTHKFIDMGDRTKIIDTIEYDLYPKFLSKIIDKLFINQKVEQIFNHRKIIIEKIFNKRNTNEVNYV
ncbi:MAG: SRPBCC family protein [Melioribacteraceae bacterium]|nr:SRPBCC family protein [Melioribacteraceae bacterium]